MADLKVATYNVNSIRSRLHIVVPWLRENAPDVLCLQETKASNEMFPQEALSNFGYEVFFSGSGGYNGVAILCREKPKEISYGFIGAGDDGDRIITARWDNISIVNIYVPQGREKGTPHFAYKLEWFSRFSEMLKENFSPRDPLIVCGDINVAPEAIDVHNPTRLLGHVCFTPEVWDAYAQWKNWGLRDVLRKFHRNEGGIFSFFDYRAFNAVKKGLGWRIDHILATDPIFEMATECWIDIKPRLEQKPSDHTPVVALFSN